MTLLPRPYRNEKVRVANKRKLDARKKRIKQLHEEGMREKNRLKAEKEAQEAKLEAPEMELGEAAADEGI